MHAMSSPEAAVKECDFKWGIKGNKGMKEGVQFYDSFSYDGVEYFLHDCVYLYTEEEPLPYIGKLVKAWETPCDKKVKVIWFFRPEEIRLHLKDYTPLKNEIFLASGEGEGLCNVNHLEVINGKCNVVCTSKDERNPQPSKAEIERADYIFSCTFDVGKHQISDKIKGPIAGIDARHFFNRKRRPQQLSNNPKPLANLTGKHENLGSKLNSGKAVGCEVMVRKTICVDGQGGKGDGVKKIPDKRTEYKPVLSTSRPKNGFNHVQKAYNVFMGDDENAVRLKSVGDVKNNGVSHSISLEEYSTSIGAVNLSEKPASVPFVYQRKVNSRVASDDKENPYRSESDVRSSQCKRKPIDDLYGEPSKKISPSGKVSDETHELTQEKRIHTDHTDIDVTQKAVDKSEWFTNNFTWEERLEEAYERRTVVLFENLDPSYSSKDIEDIIREAFRVKCTAKVIPRTSFSSSNNGQALAIFRSKQDADNVIKRSLEGNCMLDDTRILVACGKEAPKGLKEQTKFIGHLYLDKVLMKQGVEKRMAISTSHVAQRNTIEYDMSVEWIQLQQQFDLQWKELHEQQKKELDMLQGRLNREK